MFRSVIAFTVFVPTFVLAQANLGSEQNPVRAFMPAGEQEYLMRLRCPNGNEPEFERIGSFGEGPYGNTIDGYKLSCGNKVLDDVDYVYMDMYHKGYREMAPVPNFTILSDIPALVAKGCPPEVPAHKMGSYIFRPLEVKRPPKPHFDLAQTIKIGRKGRAYAEFIVDISGKVEPASLKVIYISDDSLYETAVRYFSKLEFDPAEHHPNCFVPFKGKLGVNFE